MTAKEKMTAPIASVGADVEQPLENLKTNQSIADLPGKGNLQATNNTENVAKSANKKNPDELETVSMMELYDTAYPPKLPIVEGLLYNGTYLFVGSPKIGKSFFMAQIGYHISKGLPLWGFSVRQGTVLYLALEDDYARLQKRLSQMFGMEESENFYFATKSKSLNAGLEQQLVQFVTEHKLQKQSQEMKQVQQEISSLKKQLSETRGLFKGKERKSLESKIKQAEKLEKWIHTDMEQNVKQAGYPDVQSFTKTYSKSEELIREYNNEMREWKNQPAQKKEQTSEPPTKASVLKKLHSYQQEGRQQPKRTKKKSRDMER